VERRTPRTGCFTAPGLPDHDSSASSSRRGFTGSIDSQTDSNPRGVTERKAFCEQEVWATIHPGAEQVTVLGAGYATPSWRLAGHFTDVRFLKVDHATTTIRKTYGIEAIGQPSNLPLLPVDLRTTPLTKVMAATTSWRHEVRGIVVA